MKILLRLGVTVLALAGVRVPAGAQAVAPGHTRTVVLKLSPIDLLIPHNAKLWLGAEVKLAPRLSWQTDLGYIFRSDALFDLSSEFPDLAFRTTDRSRLNVGIKTELRRYWGRDKGLNGFYGAAQLYYKQVYFNSNTAPGYDWHRYQSSIGLVPLGSFWQADRRGPETNYHIRDQEAGLNLKVGYQHIFNRLALDLFLGVGLNNERQRQDLGEPIPNPKVNYGGSGLWLPLPVAGGKLGYAF
ncbi:hypothetical protein QMK33_04345 [Hymenobacter sp. H14-R3]|uniref:hypothetical protein n=1 Tax=Hymenobacter sp. H14-R3 TaxID=3046308 RepID=UPI0024B9A967|nr:hypothetical protein [Hymenobacter sp. H14-R3]MDJ0364370.1 hypothetical protein [Hymenobacter sp. H14-R3]